MNIKNTEMDRKKFDLWFAEAQNDFEMGNILLKSHKYNGAVFYFIQSAEKAVKGLLYLFNLQPWGHSFSNLLHECEKLGVIISNELKKNAKDFERHYTRSRYPDASPTTAPKDAYNEKTAKNIRDNAKSFLDFVENEMEARMV